MHSPSIDLLMFCWIGHDFLVVHWQSIGYGILIRAEQIVSWHMSWFRVLKWREMGGYNNLLTLVICLDQLLALKIYSNFNLKSKVANLFIYSLILYSSLFISSSRGGQCVKELRIHVRTTTMLYGGITFTFFPHAIIIWFSTFG